MATISVNVSMPEDLKDRLDEARGLISISKWVQRAIEESLALHPPEPPPGQIRMPRRATRSAKRKDRS